MQNVYIAVWQEELQNNTKLKRIKDWYERTKETEMAKNKEYRGNQKKTNGYHKARKVFGTRKTKL